MIANEAKPILKLGSIVLFVAILLGAFGAHGLKSMLDESKLNTFRTGVDYQFYHGFGLLFLGLLKKQFPQLELKKSFYFMIAGIIFFSFNCYLYAISGVKFFAMIVPIGGVSFLLAWLLLFLGLNRIKD